MTPAATERQDVKDRACQFGLWLMERGALLAGALVLIFTMLAVLAFGVVQVSQRSSQQIKRLEVLNRALEDYNVAHARQAEQSFQTLLDAQRCAVDQIFTGSRLETLTPEKIAACYRPVAPAPPPPKKEE